MSEIDFEAEGLLEGLEGESRESRRRLLEELSADGVALDELRQAVAEDRLALLPVERAARPAATAATRPTRSPRRPAFRASSSTASGARSG